MKKNILVTELSNEELQNINGGVLPVIGVWAIVKGASLILGSATVGAAVGYGLYNLFD